MVPKVISQAVLFSWLIIHSVALGGDIAKPGCQSKCGNVDIPFPFGIGADCYVDEWFEVVCNNSTFPNRPLLKRTNLEVYNMSSSGQIRQFQVSYPITFWNCTGKESHEPQNLTGSPFTFSVTNNVFTAVACDVDASMSSSLKNEEEISAGCKSKCSSITHLNNSCDGVNCCQTTLPSYVKAFSTNFQITDTNRDKECKYAFVVDGSWFSSSYSRDYVSIGNMTDVPVTLEWELNYSENEIFGTELASKISLNYTCYSGLNSTSNSTSSLLCRCSQGFEGNPYLSYGCQDINECELAPRGYICGNSTATCVNTIGSYKCQATEANTVAVGFGSGTGVFFLLVGGWGLYKFIKKRNDTKRKQNFFKRNGGLLIEQQISSGEDSFEPRIKLFTSKELHKATDHFNVNRILGQGGQGTVYKGMLADGKIVAIKKSTKVSAGKVSEFINEVVILSQINQRNVVKLLGCCLETEVPLLVYEFIPNGTLSHYIHDRIEELPLTWEMRLRIATEVAGAISYLHSSASIPIFHRDIKSSNILLDEKYRAKIADFGTSRTIPIDQTHVTTMVYGTFGYLDPEYFQSSQFTDKSDVYSFGVVLVELLTGQKPVSQSRIEEGRSLASYFIMCMEENHLLEIIDDRILNEGDNEKIMAIALLAKRCLNMNGKYRPTMKEVAMELEAIYRTVKTTSSHQNIGYDNQEVEYVTGEVTKPWDVSISISSSLHNDTNSSLDVLPLLSFK